MAHTRCTNVRPVLDLLGGAREGFEQVARGRRVAARRRRDRLPRGRVCERGGGGRDRERKSERERERAKERERERERERKSEREKVR